MQKPKYPFKPTATLLFVKLYPMTLDIFIADTDADIQACFPVFSELRPHLEQDRFLAQVRRQQAQSFQILAVRQQGAIKGVAGFRFAEFLAWGKILYVDDLATLSGETTQGFAGACSIG